MLTLENQEIGGFYVVQKRLATDFEARKLQKGRSGILSPGLHSRATDFNEKNCLARITISIKRGKTAAPDGSFGNVRASKIHRSASLCVVENRQ